MFQQQQKKILDSPGIPPSVSSRDLFRGFSFVAPQLLQEMSLNSKDSETTSAKDPTNTGINTTGWIRSLNDFQFLEILGRGSFANCQRCVHIESDKQYAVKVFIQKFLSLMSFKNFFVVVFFI